MTGIARALREGLLTLAAAGGVLCIILTVLAFTGGFSLIMFKTGSMSPAIPAGSVALVQRIPASEISIGDVVTVDRDGQLPITHRVIRIAPGPTNVERSITMQGDANASEDPDPYVISEGRVVRGSVPRLAPMIVWLGSPWALGGLTIAAALVVTWAFWPRTDPAPVGGSGPRHGRRRRGPLGIAVIVATGVAPLVLPPPAAQAAGLVSITTNADGGGVHALHPRIPFVWDVDIDASSAPSDGDLAVALSGSGHGLRITTEVHSCSVAWESSGCPGAESALNTAAVLPLNGSERMLLRTGAPSTAHLRIAVTGSGTEDARATLTIRATAAQTSTTAHLGGTTLPATGGASLGLVAAPAAVLVGLGVAMLAGRGNRRPS
ncbi:S26 family signal peptidase [Microbacterium soli]